MENHNCILTTELTKTFDKLCAVDQLDLAVPKGSFYGFLGPNGAGKSTTIKMLTGLLSPTSGHAQLLGMDLAQEPLVIKQRIGVLPEEACLFKNLTALEYLIFIGRMYRMPMNTVKQRSEELLLLMGLEDTGKTLINEFSHGMQKKVSLAAALIHDPDLLFLDEPFEGIDAIASRTIRAVLEKVVERGGTIFLTSHILEIVERLCTHVGIIHQGKLISQTAMRELTNGASLEQAFIEVVGEPEVTNIELSWME